MEEKPKTEVLFNFYIVYFGAESDEKNRLGRQGVNCLTLFFIHKLFPLSLKLLIEYLTLFRQVSRFVGKYGMNCETFEEILTLSGL